MAHVSSGEDPTDAGAGSGRGRGQGHHKQQRRDRKNEAAASSGTSASSLSKLGTAGTMGKTMMMKKKKKMDTAGSPSVFSSSSTTSPTLNRMSVVVLPVVAVLIGALMVFVHFSSEGARLAEQRWSLDRCIRDDVELPVIDGWQGTSGGSFYVAVKDQRSLIRRQGHAHHDPALKYEDQEHGDESGGGGPVPVVMRRTAMVEKWRASSLWKSPEYLASRPELESIVVDVGPSNTFLHVDKGQDMWTQGIPNLPDRNYSSVMMTANEFFGKIHSVSDGKYYYHYGKVQGSLVEDIMPNEPLWRTWDDARRFGLFLWLSGADVRPAIHIDSDHNFFIHLNGSKKFVLFPPWEWKNLYVYPRIHPSWHKSQLSFDSVPLDTYPNARYIQAYEVMLEPGDVLHVPPYWFHHVESITPSVSLASWSEFSAHEPMHELFTSNYEIMSWRTYRGKDQVIAVKLYIEMLLNRVMGHQARQFLDDVLQSRWPSPMQKLVRGSESITCDENWKATGDRYMVQGLQDDVAITAECFGRLVEPSLQNTRYAKSVRDILLADWIELSASEVVGAANTFYFLRHCLFLPGK